MKGHLELFEHRLKQVGEKLPGMEGKDIDAVFDAFVEALGTDEVPFYDVHSVNPAMFARLFIQKSKNSPQMTSTKANSASTK